MGRQLVVWRHGRTTWNLAGRFQGQSDVPLDEVGHEQARRSARILAALEPAGIVSSDLGRASATAAELARLTGHPVHLDPGLRETYLGTWQGLTRGEVEERFPSEEGAWLRGELERRGGGESMPEVAERAVRAVRQAFDQLGPDDTLVAVTHGGSGRVLIGRLAGLPPEHWSALGVLSNCSWTLLRERPDRWAIAEHNAGTLPEPVLSDD
ncbi:MAG TPA: histidine phosphatase family protein [Sporichthyaceae bacterium]|jgi:probable phosphoglycerate mutase|nr:histidine phosphatase family protein [Sporichthyaceae bacterium]